MRKDGNEEIRVNQTESESGKTERSDFVQISSSPADLESLISTQETYQVKSPKARDLWKKAFLRIQSQKAFQGVNEEILLYGTSTQFHDQNNQYKRNIDQLIEEKRAKQDYFRKYGTDEELNVEAKGLILPNSKFKLVWNPVMSVTLVYTATLMPYRIAFTDEVFWDAWMTLELLVDCLFLLDIIVNFFSVTAEVDGTWETRRKVIVWRYLKGWFLIDIVACVPFSLFDYFLGTGSSGGNSSGNYNNFARLLRLPRMYKLLRIFRVIKALGHYRGSKVWERLQDLLQINSRLYKLVKFLMYVFVSVHIMACFWFFSAKIMDFNVDTWVMRYGFMDSPSPEQYLISFYWAVETVVTIGYGDIVPRTALEQMLTIAWMIMGGGFYSYTVGSMSSFLTSIDTRESIMAQKLAAVQELAIQAGLSHDMRLKVRTAIQYHTLKTGNIWSDKHSLFNELPKSLRYEVATTMYGGIVKEIYIFKHKEKAFVNFIMPLLRPMHVVEKQCLFRKGEYADEVFFITAGRVNFVLMPKEVAFKSYLKGSYVGDVEIFKGITRIYTGMAKALSELLVLTKSDFLSLLSEFPIEKKKMQRIAKERFRRDKEAYIEMTELLRIKQAKGGLQDLAGKQSVLISKDLETEIEDSEEEGEEEMIEKVKEEAENMKMMMEEVKRAAERLEMMIGELIRRTKE